VNFGALTTSRARKLYLSMLEPVKIVWKVVIERTRAYRSQVQNVQWKWQWCWLDTNVIIARHCRDLV